MNQKVLALGVFSSLLMPLCTFAQVVPSLVEKTILSDVTRQVINSQTKLLGASYKNGFEFLTALRNLKMVPHDNSLYLLKDSNPIGQIRIHPATGKLIEIYKVPMSVTVVDLPEGTVITTEVGKNIPDYLDEEYTSVWLKPTYDSVNSLTEDLFRYYSFVKFPIDFYWSEEDNEWVQVLPIPTNISVKLNDFDNLTHESSFSLTNNDVLIYKQGIRARNIKTGKVATLSKKEAQDLEQFPYTSVELLGEEPYSLFLPKNRTANWIKKNYRSHNDLVRGVINYFELNPQKKSEYVKNIGKDGEQVVLYHFPVDGLVYINPFGEKEVLKAKEKVIIYYPNKKSGEIVDSSSVKE